MTPEQKAAKKLKGVQGPGNLYSHSQLTTFLECAYRWYGSYALGLKDAPNFHLAYGHVLHAVGSEAVRAFVNGQREIPTETIQGWIADARRRYSPEGGYEVNEAGLLPEPADEAILNSTLEILGSLPDTCQQMIVEGVILQPLPLVKGAAANLDVAKCESLLLAEGNKNAYFDVLNALQAANCNGIQVKPDLTIVTADTVLFRDWKSNGRRFNKTVRDIVESYTPQVRLYAAVGRHRFPGRQVLGDIHSFEYGPPATVEMGDDNLSTVAKAAVATIKVIAAAGAQGVAGFPKALTQDPQTNACRFCHLAKIRINGEPACPEGAAYRQSKGWDKDDEEQANARIVAGIEWIGDDYFRERLLERSRQVQLAEQAAATKAAATQETGEAPAPTGAPAPTDAPASAAVDPVTEEVATWTPEEAHGYAREVVYQERLVDLAKSMRPFIERYVKLRGPIVLDAEPSRSLPAGQWAISGGREQVVWLDDVESIRAAAMGGELDPSQFIREEVDAKAVANAKPEVAAIIAAAVRQALEGKGIDPSTYVRAVPDVDALDATVSQPEVFEHLKSLRVTETTRATLKWTPDKKQPANAPASIAS